MLTRFEMRKEIKDYVASLPSGILPEGPKVCHVGTKWVSTKYPPTAEEVSLISVEEFYQDMPDSWKPVR